ncbi:hypothetical protein I3760_10G158100 [Carya illinoinensis]|nr:hypothetical protein I3760_10G158100 [Carya illinoinensis]
MPPHAKFTSSLKRKLLAARANSGRFKRSTVARQGARASCWKIRFARAETLATRAKSGRVERSMCAR